MHRRMCRRSSPCARQQRHKDTVHICTCAHVHMLATPAIPLGLSHSYSDPFHM